jgi:hypothetical protein
VIKGSPCAIAREFRLYRHSIRVDRVVYRSIHVIHDHSHLLRHLLVALMLGVSGSWASAADSRVNQDARMEALEQRIHDLEAQVSAHSNNGVPANRVLPNERAATQGPTDMAPGNPPTSGKDIPGNVYVGDNFRLRLNGSLRLHTQYNSTPVGETVSKALLPTATNAEQDAFRMFASRTRLSATVQGPNVLGAKSRGYLELDFQRQTSDGEAGAISTSPRLRHAYMALDFDHVISTEGHAHVTAGQTLSTWDLTPDTVDGNIMLGGLGGVGRRNPRIETVLAVPVATGQDVLIGLGLERPFLGTSTVGNDLGPGDLSGFPALSLGLGFATRERIGDGFGAGKIRGGVRAVYGRFEEDFTGNGFNPSAVPPTSVDDHYTALAIHGGIDIQRLGFNPTGCAHTVTFIIGGVWSQGDAQNIDAGFDRRTVFSATNSLTEATSFGGFVQPIYFMTEVMSLRAAYGKQVALNDERPAATGTFTGGDYVRHTNEQFELSLWWTPGPLTVALAWNRTDTIWRRVDPATLALTDRHGRNDKLELITWYSF